MPQHVGRHYSGTSCLCLCHFVKSCDCDDKVCVATGKSERKVLLASQEPVSAIAAEPMSGFVTPFGVTRKFGR